MFALVVVGELLAVALVLAGSSLRNFSWSQLGMVSFLVQWIVLTSAALLCPLRPLLARCSSMVAGSLSYGLVLVVTLLFSAVGLRVRYPNVAIDVWALLDNLLLAAIFAGIVLRYFYLQQQLHNQQQAELGARIQALQSRIRPHFLFNSMNSIASLIGVDPGTAEVVVEDLSELFRASLAEPALVPVSDELALCRRYIHIEQLRLGNRLRVEWDIGDYPQGAKIPGLSLQPVLENSVYHGIEPLPKGGCVAVTVKVEDHRFILEVRNPLPRKRGGGMQRSKAAGGNTRQGNQVALDNIRHRLAAHFGPGARFTAAQEGEIFVTHISYPLEI
ncbi:MAG: histidine kinase [Exilibacterium sp.]